VRVDVLAIGTEPEVLVVDDPALGLDAVMRRELLDALIDGYFPIVELLGDELEQLEERVVAGKIERNAGAIHVIRRQLLNFHRILWQQRDASTPGSPDQEIDIWSGFVVWDVKPQKSDLFLRYDTVEGDLDGTETGLPGAGAIDYLILSPDSPFDLWILGGEYFIIPSIRVGPNVEYVKYDHDPDPVNFPGRDEDLVYRATFFWTF